MGSRFVGGFVLAVLVTGCTAGPRVRLESKPPARTGTKEAASPAATKKPWGGRDEHASTRLLLRLRERRLYLLDDAGQHPTESFPIAVGRKGHETPVGRFQVEEMLEHPEFTKTDPNDHSIVVTRIPPGPTNPLGERWIQFTHGEYWTIGIHGTPRPELLGKAVSSGCVRMRNADVIKVYERVRLGTPVVVEP